MFREAMSSRARSMVGTAARRSSAARLSAWLSASRDISTVLGFFSVMSWAESRHVPALLKRYDASDVLVEGSPRNRRYGGRPRRGSVFSSVVADIEDAALDGPLPRRAIVVRGVLPIRCRSELCGPRARRVAAHVGHAVPGRTDVASAAAPRGRLLARNGCGCGAGQPSLFGLRDRVHRGSGNGWRGDHGARNQGAQPAVRHSHRDHGAGGYRSPPETQRAGALPPDARGGQLPLNGRGRVTAA